jgi:hypothetical protein
MVFAEMGGLGVCTQQGTRVLTDSGDGQPQAAVSLTECLNEISRALISADVKSR